MPPKKTPRRSLRSHPPFDFAKSGDTALTSGEMISVGDKGVQKAPRVGWEFAIDGRKTSFRVRGKVPCANENQVESVIRFPLD